MTEDTRDKQAPPRRFPDVVRREASLDALDLEPLMTVCPNCGTRFRVTEAQLQAAGGRVRCGACSSVFDGVDQLVLDVTPKFGSAQDALAALDELMSELLEEPASTRPAAQPEAGSPPIERDLACTNESPASQEFEPAAVVAAPPALEPSPEVATPQELVVPADVAMPSDVGPAADVAPPPDVGPATDVVPPSDFEPPMAPATLPDPATAGAVGSAALAANAPDSQVEVMPAVEPAAAGEGAVSAAGGATVGAPGSVAEPVMFGAPRRRIRLWVWLVVPLAVIALVAQVLWVRFDTLVREPTWRPVYARLCGWLGCELPAQRALNRIATRNLTVRAAPGAPGMLQVRVVLLNEAEFAQPFPTLEMRFSALSGTLAAGHRFQPREYLAGDARNMTLMPPGVPVQLEITIPDPGEHAVNYQLDLK